MLDAAFKLIERKGGSRTTLVEIGDLSGYSHGLVSHRFGSKGALVRAVTERLQHEFAKLLEPALAGHHGLKALTVTADVRADRRGARTAAGDSRRDGGGG
jgi:AcrR family transcriptional regulator